MKTLERATWCLSAALLLSPAAWAQDRSAGREASARRTVGGRDAMHERLRAIRLSRSNLSGSVLQLRSHLQQANQEGSGDGDFDNYSIVIPMVTSEGGARTNVGLNNFTRYSVQKGADPKASVLILLYDPSGELDRYGFYDVRSNQMLQINDIFSHRDMVPESGRGTATTGWLHIFSDEPITAWASVILDRMSNDPAMELAIADQIFKPLSFVESQGNPSNPLLIQSSVKAGSFQSRLAVVNIGVGTGRLRIKLFDRNGALQRSLPPVDVRKHAMFVSDDIRSSVPGSYGQIVIEVDYPEEYDGEPVIVATSLVESTTGPFAGFFPAFAMPQPDTMAIAGIWEGELRGTIMNADVKVALHQERDMLYGALQILSGTFPTIDREFLITGEVINGSILLEIQNFFDAPPSRDSLPPFIGYRMFADEVEGQMMSGDTIYFDGMERFDKGHFTLERKHDLYDLKELE